MTAMMPAFGVAENQPHLDSGVAATWMGWRGSAEVLDMCYVRDDPQVDVLSRIHVYRLGSASGKGHLYAIRGGQRLEALLAMAAGGSIEGSLFDISAATGCDVETARQAVATLDPVDHVVSVDVERVSEHEPFTVAWAPVTGIVNLLLDWDLLTVEITLGELAQWLEVSRDVTARALDRLAKVPGVGVSTLIDAETVKIVIIPGLCPLTAEVSSVVA